MLEYILTLTASENLVITSGSAESMAHECLAYIPGNMLLGAMTTVWKRAHHALVPDDNPEFCDLFLTGKVSWGHALPLCCAGQSVPIPLAYVYDKNHGSLPPEGAAFAREDYWLCNQLALEADQSVEDLWKQSFPAENIKIKKMGAGFMNPASLHRIAERRAFSVHVALGEDRSALESQLYGYSALARGTMFKASVLCHDESVVSALKDLLTNARRLHVGHARSAGYGRVEVKYEERVPLDKTSPSQKVHTLFLCSQFLPAPDWLDPYSSLEAELSRLTSSKAKIIGNFSAIGEIQAYNSLWNRPRASRFGLNMGSSFKISFDTAVSLPDRLFLGGGQTEGYGHILCNPPFLAKPVPDILPPALIKAPSTRDFGKIDPASLPVWRIMRQRIAARQLSALITSRLNEQVWKNFLDDVSRLSRPSASQRNNLRHIDLKTFEDMLKKNPGEQWRQAIARCPFTNRKDHLSSIMLKLLDPQIFAGKWNFEAFNLPGSATDKEERTTLERKAHKLFINQLVSVWGNLSRLSEKE